MRRLALVLALATLAPLGAQQPAPGSQAPRSQRTVAPADSALEARTRAVAAQLRCPVCQGLSLADSPSELAQEMKDVVRDQLAAGQTPEQVKQYFVAKYGEWILLQPEASGFNLVVYFLPVLALIAGGTVIVVVVRRWVRAAGAQPPDAGPAQGAMESRNPTTSDG